MKIESAHGADILQVSCPHCGARATIRERAESGRPITALCPRCDEKFSVKIDFRRFYRKPVEIPVKITAETISRPCRQMAREGIIIDISREGICIESTETPTPPHYYKEGPSFTLLPIRVEPKNRYSFFFTLPPREELLKIGGEVAWIKPKEQGEAFRMGVHFQELDDQTRRKIGFFLIS